MKTWLDFEKRFRDLSDPFRFISLDVQTGEHGEYWRLTGGFDRALFGQFEELCRLAGERLTAIYTDDPEKAELLNDPDPMIRWYRAMKEEPGAYQNPHHAYTEDDDGTRRYMYSGTIPNVPETAANLCLKLQRTSPIREPAAEQPAFLTRFWREYGKAIVIGVIVSLISLLVGVAIGSV